MTMQVTITLTDDLYKHFQWLSDATGESIEAIIADILDQVRTFDYTPVDLLSDAEVLALANSMIPDEQQQRFSDLMALNRSSSINESDREELKNLLKIYH